jgi:hypothetical protein
MSRTPVSATVLGGFLIVVCDDGSVWEMDPDGRWTARRPIPGTPADESRSREDRAAAPSIGDAALDRG